MKVLKRILTLVLVCSCLVQARPANCAPVDAQGGKYPSIVIYTAWYCTSCKAAGEYLTKNRIPFVKKDVDLNDEYMEELSRKYKISAVPVIVIGNNEMVLRGFNRDVFDKAVREFIAGAK